MVEFCHKYPLTAIIFNPYEMNMETSVFFSELKKIDYKIHHLIAIPPKIDAPDAISLMKMGTTDIILRNDQFKDNIKSAINQIIQESRPRNSFPSQLHPKQARNVLTDEVHQVNHAILNNLFRTELYTSIFKTLDVIVHVLNTDYRFVMVNTKFRTYCENLLINPDVIGKKFQECFPDIPQNIMDEYKHVFVSGEQLSTQDNTTIKNHHYISQTGKFPINHQGKVIGVLTMITDMSENSRTSDLLQKHERLLKSTQEFTKVGGWVTEPKEGMTFWTEETYRIHGLPPVVTSQLTDELVQLSLSCYDQKDQEKIYTAFKLSYEEGIPYDMEVPFTALDGKKKWIRTKAKPIYDNGKITAVVGAFQDVSEMKKKYDLKVKEQHFLHEKARILSKLATSEYFRIGDILSFSRMLVEEVCPIFKVNQASVWLFDSVTGDLLNIDFFELETTSHSSGEVLNKLEFQKEFDYLIDSKYIAISDARTDPRTQNYSEKYLIPRQITSAMDISISFGEKPLGILCFEHIQKNHHWTENEISFGGQLADQLALVVANRDKRLAEIEIHQLAELLDVAPNSIYVHNQRGEFLYYNKNACEMHGYTKDEFSKCNLVDLVENEKKFEISRWTNARLIDGDFNDEVTHNRKDGSKFPMEILSKQVQWGNDLAILCIGVDITERRQIEEKLLQSRKMEAVGQLAAGIAHDFNNILAGILGAGEILKDIENLDPENVEFIDQIIRDANRGADLTKKLLSFGRKKKKSFNIVDFHQVVLDTVAILKRSINKKIEINVSLNAGTMYLNGNASELQTALLNLGINSGHAMENGGKIHFSTENVVISANPQNPHFSNLVPGDYIQIVIEDSGCGIPPKNLSKLFDPFFTTKKPGKGTGLGLSIVYGIIKDHKGQIWVESEVGRGTKIYLVIPSSEEIPIHFPHINQTTPINGSGKILLVDDEFSLRISGKRMLESFGYTVLIAENGKVATELYRQHNREVDLVLLDMIMPEMNGVETFQMLKKIRPDCKVIISSGYSNDSDLELLQKNGLAGFIQKPFHRKDLGLIIQRVLKEKD